MSKNPYESDELLQQYLIFHYANAEEQFPYAFGAVDALGFPQRCVSEGLDAALLPDAPRALDLGCSVGRSTFELARKCREVIGIAYSQAFIDAANRMKTQGLHPAWRLDEGSATTLLDLKVDAAHLSDYGKMAFVGAKEWQQWAVGATNFLLLGS